MMLPENVNSGRCRAQKPEDLRTSTFILLLCLNYYAALLFSRRWFESKQSFRIWGRLWWKETFPIKEKGEEKGIHLIQDDWRGRNHSYLIIDAFHTISVILREERVSHPQPGIFSLGRCNNNASPSEPFQRRGQWWGDPIFGLPVLALWESLSLPPLCRERLSLAINP